MRLTLSSPSLIERMPELGDQVLHVFDSDGQAHQAIADAKARAHVLGQRSVRHDRRMLDQALDATEALGEREELAALEEALRCAESAFEHGGDPSAIALVHLLGGEQVLRMAGEIPVDYSLQ